MVEIGNEQPLQQRLLLRRAKQTAGPLHQPVGVAGVWHAADAREVDILPHHAGSGAHLSLALAHCLLAAQALKVELFEGYPIGWQPRQQLHALPVNLHLHMWLLTLQQQQRSLQVPLANQAPGADEIEEHLDGQLLFHSFNSWRADDPCRGGSDVWQPRTQPPLQCLSVAPTAAPPEARSGQTPDR
ncbi:hypothetical protein D3C75_747420 [compost metagenome]